VTVIRPNHDRNTLWKKPKDGLPGRGFNESIVSSSLIASTRWTIRTPTLIAAQSKLHTLANDHSHHHQSTIQTDTDIPPFPINPLPTIPNLHRTMPIEAKQKGIERVLAVPRSYPRRPDPNGALRASAGQTGQGAGAIADSWRRMSGKPLERGPTAMLLTNILLVVIITTVNSKQIIRLLEDDGWTLRGVRGSHHIYTHPSKPGHLSVPHPKNDLGIGLVNKLLKQAGLK
jgi:predicted RNA binding protein YcfA (HicA-like mRNA interferase family)